MVATLDVRRRTADSDPAADGFRPVGGPVSTGWQERTLTRASELQALTASVWLECSALGDGSENAEDLRAAVGRHLDAARDAARRKCSLRRPHQSSLIERASSNLDAAEAHLLHLAPSDYVLGQMPSLLNHVQRHLAPTDPRRRNFEYIAARVGVRGPGPITRKNAEELTQAAKLSDMDLQRGTIVSAVRGASSAALREQLKLRSFRNVVVVAILASTFLAVALGFIGLMSPTTLPLCFQPESGGQTLLVCPTRQSVLSDISDLARVTGNTVDPKDLFVVELVGLAAAAVAAATAIRGLRGSSERSGLPLALTVLKLPTGALTAVLGLILLRGEFVPGLSALDSPGQILAWALVFGYGQELFTRLIDRQGQQVLNGVRGASNASAEGSPEQLGA